MKPFHLLFFLSFFSLQAQKKKISITITYLQPYCGGARPSEEMLQEAEKAKPYASRSIIYTSKKGKIDTARTDENGQLKLKLKKGEYMLFESWRYYLYTPDNIPIDAFDRQCLREEWQKALCRVVVSRKDVKIIGLNPISKFCSWNAPCLLNPEAPQ